MESSVDPIVMYPGMHMILRARETGLQRVRCAVPVPTKRRSRKLPSESSSSSSSAAGITSSSKGTVSSAAGRALTAGTATTIPLVTKRLSFQRLMCSRLHWLNQFQLASTLKKHRGCVNAIDWSDDGQFLATGSDDCMVGVWHGGTGQLRAWLTTGHVRNIFSTRFQPNSGGTNVISCGMDGAIRLCNVSRSACSKIRASVDVENEGDGDEVSQDDELEEINQTVRSDDDIASVRRQRSARRMNLLAAAGSGHLPGEPGRLLHQADHMVYKLKFLPTNPFVFLSTHNNGQIRLFDVRQRTGTPSSSGSVLVNLSAELTEAFERSANDVAFQPNGTRTMFVVGAASPMLYMFDLRRCNAGGSFSDYLSASAGTSTQPPLPCVGRYLPRPLLSRMRRTRRPSNALAALFGSLASGGSVPFASGVDWCPQGEIVATYSGADAYAFRVGDANNAERCTTVNEHPGVCVQQCQRYRGHDNRKTFLKEISFLCDGRFVATGSDDGGIYLWERRSGRLVNVLPGDKSIVNGVSGHPSLPVLASCGIEHDAKIWGPIAFPEADSSDSSGQAVDDSSDDQSFMFSSFSGGSVPQTADGRRALVRKLQAERELFDIDCDEQAVQSGSDNDDDSESMDSGDQRAFLRSLASLLGSEDPDSDVPSDEGEMSSTSNSDDWDNDSDNNDDADDEQQQRRRRRRQARLQRVLQLLQQGVQDNQNDEHEEEIQEEVQEEEGIQEEKQEED